MHELRCDNGILFGIVEERFLDVKCRSRRCGHEAGVVVIHRFDLGSGDLQGTRKFKDPTKKGGMSDGASRHRPSLRSA
jgi:hypothetical protein